MSSSSAARARQLLIPLLPLTRTVVPAPYPYPYQAHDTLCSLAVGGHNICVCTIDETSSNLENTDVKLNTA